VTRAAQRHQASQAARADHGRVLILLYEGAIRFLGEAATAFVEKREAEGLDRVHRAERILRELARTLDLAQGGKIAHDLNRLYDYCSRRLIAAGAERDPAPVTEVAGVLDNLLGAWRQALRKLTPASPTELADRQPREERPQ
jgi:flagellar protein FliS